MSETVALKTNSVENAGAITTAEHRLHEHGSGGLSIEEIKKNRAWFTSELYHLLVHDKSGPDGIGYLNWDPFTGAQDDVGPFSFESTRAAGDTVNVLFTYLQKRDSVVVSMKKVSGSWRIANFLYPGNNPCHRNLVLGLVRWAKDIQVGANGKHDPCIE